MSARWLHVLLLPVQGLVSNTKVRLQNSQRSRKESQAHVLSWAGVFGRRSALEVAFEKDMTLFSDQLRVDELMGALSVRRWTEMTLGALVGMPLAAFVSSGPNFRLYSAMY